MTNATHRRAGFTLIELIVVLSIILLLMALTLSAIFRVREAQLEKNTNTHLRKIYIGFMQQWDATRDQIAKEPIPQPIKDLTRSFNGQFDPDRARAIHMKLRLRQEFPQTQGELYSKFSMQSVTGQTADYSPGAFLVQGFQQAQLVPLSPTNDDANAALLYLILSRGKGGVTFDGGSVAPTSTVSFPKQGGGTVTLKVLVDEWGSPITFRRQVDDDNTLLVDEFNQPPFVSAAQVQSGNRDPDDPAGRLRFPSSQWWTEPQMVLNGQTVQNVNGRDLFSIRWGLSQPNPQFRPYVVDAFDGRNRGPTVISAGKDKTYWYAPFNGFDDNLYAHRLQQARTGN